LERWLIFAFILNKVNIYNAFIPYDQTYPSKLSLLRIKIEALDKRKFDKLVKSHFANDIEQFWKKIQNEPGVKNFKLFDPPQAESSCNLARGIMNPKIAHGESKIRLFTKPSSLL